MWPMLPACRKTMPATSSHSFAPFRISPAKASCSAISCQYSPTPEGFVFSSTRSSPLYRCTQTNSMRSQALKHVGSCSGPALAAQLGKGFIAIRKAGKLPPPVHACSYALEYGKATLEIEDTSVRNNERILIVDDLIATGGSAAAAKGSSSNRLEARSQATNSSWNWRALTDGRRSATIHTARC